MNARLKPGEKKLLPLNSGLHGHFCFQHLCFFFLIFWPKALTVGYSQGSAKQTHLEGIPAKSRGLRSTEVVFFLITYKNRSQANHRLCDWLQIPKSQNSPKLESALSQQCGVFELFLRFESLTGLERRVRQKGKKKKQY